MSPEFSVKPVDTASWQDFEALFEEKGGPKYCWCMAWRNTKEELKENTSAKRKGYIHKRVEAGTPIGLLAYTDGQPVAWCSVAPRETYRPLGGDESLTDVWSIVCFFVKRDFRKQGMVHLLIEEAGKYAQANGAKFLEATPVDPESPSYHFMGLVQNFEEAGFHYVQDAGSRRHVMIKAI